jgi:hypothetical protein
MAHRLDSAYLKLSRATEHVKEVEAEAKLFFDAYPYIALPKYDFESGEHSFRIRALAKPPSHLGLITADALQNLRSALDHLIYQLADLDPNVPRGERTQYPIYDDPSVFDAKSAPQLEGVPPEHRATIRTLQPYNPSFALLGPLRRLNDRDKHRVLEAFVSRATGLKIATDPVVVANITDIRQVTDPVYLDDDAVLGTFRSDREVPMTIEFRYTMGFGLRDGPRLNPEEIRRLIQLVAVILAHFRSAFD